MERVKKIVEELRSLPSNQLIEIFISAVSNGCVELVKLCIEAEVDINSNSSKGENAIFEAVISQKKRILEILIDAGADVNIGNGKALCIATSLNNIEIARILINAGVYVNAQKGIPICRAVENGNFEMVVLLIEAGAEIEVYNGYPIITAMEMGYNDIMRILFRRGGVIANKVYRRKWKE